MVKKGKKKNTKNTKNKTIEGGKEEEDEDDENNGNVEEVEEVMSDGDYDKDEKDDTKEEYVVESFDIKVVHTRSFTQSKQKNSVLFSKKLINVRSLRVRLFVNVPAQRTHNHTPTRETCLLNTHTSTLVIVSKRTKAHSHKRAIVNHAPRTYFKHI